MSDYISRGAAIEIAMRYCPDDDGSCSDAGTDLREMLDELEAIPAANVRENKPGKWVEVGRHDIHCSVCGELALGVRWWECDLEKSKFCPNCGAEMENPEEDK